MEMVEEMRELREKIAGEIAAIRGDDFVWANCLGAADRILAIPEIKEALEATGYLEAEIPEGPLGDLIRHGREQAKDAFSDYVEHIASTPSSSSE